MKSLTPEPVTLCPYRTQEVAGSSPASSIVRAKNFEMVAGAVPFVDAGPR